MDIRQKFVACLAKECRGAGVVPDFKQVVPTTMFL